MIIPLPQQEESEGLLVKEPFSKVGLQECTGVFDCSLGTSCSLRHQLAEQVIPHQPTPGCSPTTGLHGECASAVYCLNFLKLLVCCTLLFFKPCNNTVAILNCYKTQSLLLWSNDCGSALTHRTHSDSRGSQELSMSIWDTVLYPRVTKGRGFVLFF